MTGYLSAPPVILSTRAHVYLVCAVTVFRWGGEQVRRRCCWTYRNWSVECLIDQMRQPWGDCLSRSSSLNRSRCEALSLLCLCVVAFCFFYSEELFLLKLSALNYCTELVRTNWPWRTCRELHVLVRYPKLTTVGCVNGKNISFFLFYWCKEISVVKDISSNFVCLRVCLPFCLCLCRPHVAPDAPSCPCPPTFVSKTEPLLLPPRGR